MEDKGGAALRPFFFFGPYSILHGKAMVCDLNYEVPPQLTALWALSLMGSISPGLGKAGCTAHETHSLGRRLSASNPAGMGIYSGS